MIKVFIFLMKILKTPNYSCSMLFVSCRASCTPHLNQTRVFPAGENMSDMDNLLLCAACVKGNSRRCPDLILHTLSKVNMCKQLLFTCHVHTHTDTYTYTQTYTDTHKHTHAEGVSRVDYTSGFNSQSKVSLSALG